MATLTKYTLYREGGCSADTLIKPFSHQRYLNYEHPDYCEKNVPESGIETLNLMFFRVQLKKYSKKCTYTTP